jgi:hypothetical protein
MSQPSTAALNPEVIAIWRDRLGRLIARRRGKPVKVPEEVRDLVDEGHELGTLWARDPDLGGGIRPCPWFLTGRGPNGELS